RPAIAARCWQSRSAPARPPMLPVVVTPVTNILHCPRVWQLHGVHEPPQSTPASLPFWMPSLHVGTWQWPSTQTWLVQSLPTLHARPLLHCGHVPPPQSTSVSAPFFTKSLQVAAWQTFEMQTPLTQSPASLQP